jgi:hypothetical protein
MKSCRMMIAGIDGGRLDLVVPSSQSGCLPILKRPLPLGLHDAR